jgi:hypothetical protein
MTDERLKAVLEFAGKLILPVVILTVVIMFKPVIEQLPGTAESAEFMGIAIKFRATPGFRGDLTPKALYYLIGASEGGGVRYETRDQTQPIDELRDKGLVSVSIKRNTVGSPEMRGTWAELEPTAAGRQFLEAMQMHADHKGRRTSSIGGPDAPDLEQEDVQQLNRPVSACAMSALAACSWRSATLTRLDYNFSRVRLDSGPNAA